MEPSQPSSQIRRPQPCLGRLWLLPLLPLLTALRPVESFDGTTTPPGAMAIEWGALGWQRHGDRSSLVAPQLLVRLGLTPRLELGALGAYRFAGPAAQPPWGQEARAGEVGLYGKLQILPGLVEEGRLHGPAAALMGGAMFLTEQSTWAAHGRVAGSMGIGPVLAHLNLGFRYDATARVVLGAVVAAPLSFGLTPLLEVSGEVRFGQPSRASLQVGLTQELRGAPLQVDLALGRGLSEGAPEWTITAGLTATLRLWRPTSGAPSSLGHDDGRPGG